MSHAPSVSRETGFHGSSRIDCRYANMGATQHCRHTHREKQVTSVRTAALRIPAVNTSATPFAIAPNLRFLLKCSGTPHKSEPRCTETSTASLQKRYL